MRVLIVDDEAPARRRLRRRDVLARVLGAEQTRLAGAVLAPPPAPPAPPRLAARLALAGALVRPGGLGCAIPLARRPPVGHDAQKHRMSASVHPA